MSDHRLRVNDLILSAGDGVTGDDSGTWWLDVYGSDFTTGDAEPIEVTMRTLLQDGARVITTGYGNREATFYVIVGGVDSRALAAAERELALNLGRRGELGWLPADGWAPETVLDVETSSMTAGGPGEDADLRELEHNERVYQLRFVCQPFVRASELTVVPAVTVPVEALDEDVVNAGTALAGWTAPIGTLTDAGNYLQVAGTRTPRATFTPAAPIDNTTQPYVSLLCQGGGVPYCSINGRPAVLIGTDGVGDTDLPNGTRYFWRANQGSQFPITSLDWGVSIGPGGSPSPFRFKDLRIRNLPPFSGTLRQSRRSIEIDGSARTQGSVAITAPVTKHLGQVVFYTTSLNANIPSLRPYSAVDVDNPPAADDDAVSGFVQFMGTPKVFDIPVGDVAAGKCQILTRLAEPFGSPATGAVTWTAQTRVAGLLVGPTVTGQVDVSLASNAFKLVALGTTDLPTVDLPDTSQATIRLTVQGNHHYDEMWLLNLDHGAVTTIEAGNYRRAWIETATTGRPRPAVYVGDAADKSNAFHNPALVGAWGTHEFAPPLTNALVVTSNCDGPEVAFEFYPRFFNFVADPA